ncbi:PEGA domain-containing protein [Alienimonas californiensis]|uniref:PEGA domain protein n=1 Tax=Alienimonas californiensis TaxID=2527989 RepID=A0A517PCD6_9PLAN|nr:PEGA domain-containing protein [Alienimonas californiensis]QDT17035.1 PEGA domain protein [Alienimonas californiensis]
MNPAPHPRRTSRPAGGRPAVRRRAAIARLWALAAAATLLGSGCNSVHRRLTIDSQPRGALVMVDGERIGYTPASISYDYYATRRITLVKDGYETQSFLQPIEAPWWQIPPADFVTDNFLPHQVEDRRVIFRNLAPKVLAPTEDVLIRADDLRNRSQLEP